MSGAPGSWGLWPPYEPWRTHEPGRLHRHRGAPRRAAPDLALPAGRRLDGAGARRARRGAHGRPGRRRVGQLPVDRQSARLLLPLPDGDRRRPLAESVRDVAGARPLRLAYRRRPPLLADRPTGAVLRLPQPVRELVALLRDRGALLAPALPPLREVGRRAAGPPPRPQARAGVPVARGRGAAVGMDHAQRVRDGLTGGCARS